MKKKRRVNYDANQLRRKANMTQILISFSYTIYIYIQTIRLQLDHTIRKEIKYNGSVSKGYQYHHEKLVYSSLSMNSYKRISFR